MTKRVLLIAFLGAALIFLVRLFELKYLEGELSMKLYMLLIGVLFAGIGLWFGLQFRKREAASGSSESPESSPSTSLSFEKGSATDSDLTSNNNPTLVSPQHNDILTTRETELLLLLAKGMSNKEIADQIFVSENTVKKHLTNIYRKLDVSRRTQAVNKARELGIVPS